MIPIKSSSEAQGNRPEDSFLAVTMPQYCVYFTGHKNTDTITPVKKNPYRESREDSHDTG